MRLASAIAGALLALGMTSVPAAAQQQPAAVTDVAGDANALNAQSQHATGGTNGFDTRPASIEGADLREIRFQTTYSTSRILAADGTVARVVYRSTGLRGVVTMQGDVRAGSGPSSVVVVLARVIRPTGQTCNVLIQAWLRGPYALPDDLERADIRRSSSGCPTPTTIAEGFTQTINGKTVTVDYPLDAPGMPGFIENGTRIDPPVVAVNGPGYIYIRTQGVAVPPIPGVIGGGSLCQCGQIDLAPMFPGFTVGSDVPPDVDCVADPLNAACN